MSSATGSRRRCWRSSSSRSSPPSSTRTSSTSSRSRSSTRSAATRASPSWPRRHGGQPCAQHRRSTVCSRPFTLALKVSLMAGVVARRPVWLYQLWAFVAPGLHRQREEVRARASSARASRCSSAAPTSPTGSCRPRAKVLLDFTPDGIGNLLPLDELLDLVPRMVVVFGLSFELPLLLVMLNFTGVLTGKRMLGWWRGDDHGHHRLRGDRHTEHGPARPCSRWPARSWCCTSAPSASPCSTTGARRRDDPRAGLDDDEASELDLTPEDIGEVEPVPPAAALPEQAERRRRARRGAATPARRRLTDGRHLAGRRRGRRRMTDAGAPWLPRVAAATRARPDRTLGAVPAGRARRRSCRGRRRSSRWPLSAAVSAGRCPWWPVTRGRP